MGKWAANYAPGDAAAHVDGRKFFNRESGRMMADAHASHGGLQTARNPDGTLTLSLSGSWRSIDHVPGTGDVEAALQKPPLPSRIAFECKKLGAWDSGALTFLMKTVTLAGERKVTVDTTGLPSGMSRLLKLATTVPE
jgi:ABC-type transporter Mla MlaB component